MQPSFYGRAAALRREHLAGGLNPEFFSIHRCCFLSVVAKEAFAALWSPGLASYSNYQHGTYTR